MCEKSVASICLAILTFVLAATASGVTQYTITDLGALGGDWSAAKGINDHGQIVGCAETADGVKHAFLWQGGTMVNVGLPGEYASCAHDINESGQVVGDHWTAEGVGSAFLLDNGTTTLLGTGEGVFSQARAINASRQIVGWVDNPHGSQDAFLWQDGVMTVLGVLGGGGTEAYGINDSGWIVGTAIAPAAWWHACLWLPEAPDSPIDLGTLGGSFSRAHDINSAGQVIGGAYVVGDVQHAFLWEDGTMHDLGVPWAKGINDLGQVLGSSKLWENGVECNLNDLIPAGCGWTVVDAVDVNNAGQIVGYGINPDGASHAFLLTPIPEPSVLALAAPALFGLLRKLRGQLVS